MRSRDGSLVFFTILTQASIGIVLCLGLLALLYPDVGSQVANNEVLDKSQLLALLLVSVATLASTLHLGNPRNAPRALNNLAGSWLSREILAIGLYSLCLVLMIMCSWICGPSTTLSILVALTCMAGVALLWTMSRVYMIPTIPPWNTWYTPLGFTSTALSLGSLVLLMMHTLPGPAADFLLGLLSSMLMIELVSAPVQQSQLRKMSSGIATPEFASGVFYRVYITRMVILLTVLLIMLLLTLPAKATGPGNWVYPLLILVLLEEVLGRVLFYSSYFRTGV